MPKLNSIFKTENILPISNYLLTKKRILLKSIKLLRNSIDNHFELIVILKLLIALTLFEMNFLKLNKKFSLNVFNSINIY